MVNTNEKDNKELLGTGATETATSQARTKNGVRRKPSLPIGREAIGWGEALQHCARRQPSDRRRPVEADE